VRAVSGEIDGAVVRWNNEKLRNAVALIIAASSDLSHSVWNQQARGSERQDTAQIEALPPTGEK